MSPERISSEPGKAVPGMALLLTAHSLKVSPHVPASVRLASNHPSSLHTQQMTHWCPPLHDSWGRVAVRDWVLVVGSRKWRWLTWPVTFSLLCGVHRACQGVTSPFSRNSIARDDLCGVPHSRECLDSARITSPCLSGRVPTSVPFCMPRLNGPFAVSSALVPATSGDSSASPLAHRRVCTLRAA